jgi:PAS domain S-box-containing protein
VSEPVSVLLVDDDPDFADLTAEQLRSVDDVIDPRVETSPQEALDRLKNGAADIECVVSDYEMPEMDGLELLDRIRDRDPDIPVILFTGRGSEAIASEAISRGVTDYLQKAPGEDQYTILANRIHNAVGRYRAEQEAKETEQRLRRVQQRISDGVLGIDTDWRYTYVNDEAEETLGMSESELVGSRVWDVYPELENTEMGAALRTAMETTERTTAREYYPPLDKWFAIRVYPADDGLSVYFVDVTGEEQRAEELTFFQELVDTVGVAVGVYGADGTFEYVNEAYGGLLEMDRSALLGTPIWEINPAVDPEQFEGYWASIDEGETRVDEGTHRRADGTTIPIEAITTCRTIGDTRYHFGTVREIRARKELERQQERFRSFAKKMSHDVRNPLEVARGKLNLAVETGDLDHLDDVDAAIDRIEGLLDHTESLADQGSIVGEPQSVDLGELVERCWRTVETADARLESSVSGTIRADPERLRTLLENLLGNAVEHGGSTATVRVESLADGFAVADDGSGISPDIRDEVFDPGRTTNRGAGLGLAIVEEIAHAHGWDIHVRESADGGARFEVTGVEQGD